VVITDKQKAELQDTPLMGVKPSDVLLKVAYVGVCRTDLEVYDGKLAYYKQGIAKYPIVPGHEFSGVIVKVGANSRAFFKTGDRVVGECILSCGNCSLCQKGLNTACLKRKEVGVMNYNGAYAHLMVLPSHYIHKIPEEMDLKVACLIEPLAVVLRAMSRTLDRIKPNSSCAVIGVGPIGNLCAQVLLSLGHKVTVFDKNEDRLQLLKNKVQTHKLLEGLERFDLIVEATGMADLLKRILVESRSYATILLLGFPYGKIDYNFENLVGSEKIIIGSVGGDQENFRKAILLLPTLDTIPFTKNILSLEEFNKAWQFQRTSKYLKVILKI